MLSSQAPSVASAALPLCPTALMEPVGYHRFLLARTDALLGKFIVLTQTDGDNGEVRVVSGARANQIYANVFTAVLDGARLVNLSSRAGHGRAAAVLHLTKPSLRQSSDDIMQLRRLGPSVNLTVHDGQAEARKVVDVRLHLGGTGGGGVLNIRYGVSQAKEAGRLVRHALRSLAARVWERELENDAGRWNAKERSQIQMTGSLAGYELEHIRSPHDYPELTWDIANIRVVRGKRHRG